MHLSIKQLLKFCQASIILWLATANYIVFTETVFNEIYGYACGNVGAL